MVSHGLPLPSATNTDNTGDWAEPWDTESEADKQACITRLEFAVSWFADPVYFGHYPASMRKQLGSRLPEFTEKEVSLVKGSNDFYGMNHYCANYIKHKSTPAPPEDYVGNVEVLFEDKQGNKIGPDTQSVWLKPSPPGFRKMLKWLSDRYGKPVMYVTENGTSIKGENDLPMEKILEDDFRLEYFRGYVEAMAQAVAEDGVDCRGYMAWSLLE